MTWRRARMAISLLCLLVNGYLIVLWVMLAAHYQKTGLQTQLKISRGQPITEEQRHLHDHWRSHHRRGSYYVLAWEYVSNPTTPPVKRIDFRRPNVLRYFLESPNDSALDWAGTLLWFGAFEILGLYCSGVWVESITGRNRRAIDRQSSRLAHAQQAYTGR